MKQHTSKKTILRKEKGNFQYNCGAIKLVIKILTESSAKQEC